MTHLASVAQFLLHTGGSFRSLAMYPQSLELHFAIELKKSKSIVSETKVILSAAHISDDDVRSTSKLHNRARMFFQSRIKGLALGSI